MNTVTEACTEAWKFQQAEWLYDADEKTVALARSWFSAGWTGGVKWQASRPITDDQARSLIAELDGGCNDGGDLPDLLSRAARMIESLTTQSIPDPSECDHEFTDHCVFCGVDAHEWFNHYAEGVWS